MFLRILTSASLLALVAGCGPDYSPDTYSSSAVQQANKVEQGVIVGVRDVAVSASGTMGAVTGGAAGGIAGAQVGAGPTSAFAALGGTLVGGLTGAAVEHATGDTKAYEYIVRKGNGDLVSVTQKDKVPLVLAQKVLVIAGNQARVVPDYTVNLTPSEKEKERAAVEAVKAADAAKATEEAKSGEPAQAANAPSSGGTPGPAASTIAPSSPVSISAPPSASISSAPPSAAGAAPVAAPTSGPGDPIRLTDPLPSPGAITPPGK